MQHLDVATTVPARYALR